MHNVYMIHRQDMDSVVAQAITCFYMDYYKREIRTVRLPDPDAFPWQEASAESRLFLVGFTPGYQVFVRLIEQAGDLVWIDNNMKKVAPMEASSSREHNFRKIKGKRAGDLSLCELTWDSYFAWVRKRPEIVDLVGRYTMGNMDHPNWSSTILPFNLGLALQKTDPLDATVFEEFWKKILCLKRDLDYEASLVTSIVEKGKEKVS